MTQEPLRCWCGNRDLEAFSPEYAKCSVCETLVSLRQPDRSIVHITDEEHDLYGQNYWFAHQEHDLGFSTIKDRARTDLPERGLFWLRTLLKYKLPPAQALELGSAHGGFVALLRWAGFEARGLELSPWVVDFAQQTFDVPMLLGPVEEQAIAPGSLDIVVLMDVLEHLPDPMSTLQHCLSLLTSDGFLLIQTPQFPSELSYEAMRAEQSSFLQMLQSKEHLYLFSKQAVRELFRRLGAEHIVFEPAIFGHYDMFMAVSRMPLTAVPPEDVVQSLSSTPHGRLVLALLDSNAEHLAALERQKASLGALQAQLQASEADRAARLELIEQQGVALGRIPALEADVAFLKERLQLSEADRAARFEVIQRQGAELGQIQRQIAAAVALLRATPKLARFGMALPHEVMQMSRMIERLRALFAQGQPSSNGVVPTEKLPAPGGPLQQVAASGSPAAVQLNQQQAFAQLRAPKTNEPLQYTPEIIRTIIEDLREQGFSVEDLTLTPEEYRAYFAAAQYTTRYPTYYDFNLPEKSLEHFIAAKLLGLTQKDVYIDIASEHSPVPEIYTRLFGCTTYRQDLAYPPGLHGDEIGGDAAAMPVPDGFATKMALHCSFEHFEGDADIRFITEINRVLQPGGRVCFAPIYLFREYAVLTDPVVAVAQQVPFEEDATIYAKPGWLNRHGRFYDPAHLARRVKQQLGTMNMTIYRVTNATDIDPSCYIQFAAVIAKP